MPCSSPCRAVWSGSAPRSTLSSHVTWRKLSWARPRGYTGKHHKRYPWNQFVHWFVDHFCSKSPKRFFVQRCVQRLKPASGFQAKAQTSWLAMCLAILESYPAPWTWEMTWKTKRQTHDISRSAKLARKMYHGAFRGPVSEWYCPRFYWTILNLIWFVLVLLIVMSFF